MAGFVKAATISDLPRANQEGGHRGKTVAAFNIGELS
jgi:hypothetical protein